MTVSNSTLPNDIADLETLEEEQGELANPIQTKPMLKNRNFYSLISNIQCCGTITIFYGSGSDFLICEKSFLFTW
jgi:hypothetical protein